MMLRKAAVLVSAAAMTMTLACAQTDTGVTASVKSKLAADDMVKASDIDVSTLDHAVSLEGQVESRAVKERALAIARETKGVETVIDNLVVAGDAVATSGSDVPEPARDGDAAPMRDPDDRDLDDQAKEKTADAKAKAEHTADHAGDAVSDAAVTTAVKTKLLGDTATPGLKIDVDTKDGVVTLSGEVATAAERTNAVKIAKGTSGVKRVVDKLTVAKAVKK